MVTTSDRANTLRQGGGLVRKFGQPGSHNPNANYFSVEAQLGGSLAATPGLVVGYAYDASSVASASETLYETLTGTSSTQPLVIDAVDSNFTVCEVPSTTNKLLTTSIFGIVMLDQSSSYGFASIDGFPKNSGITYPVGRSLSIFRSGKIMVANSDASNAAQAGDGVSVHVDTGEVVSSNVTGRENDTDYIQIPNAFWVQGAAPAALTEGNVNVSVGAIMLNMTMRSTVMTTGET